MRSGKLLAWSFFAACLLVARSHAPTPSAGTAAQAPAAARTQPARAPLPDGTPAPPRDAASAGEPAEALALARSRPDRPAGVRRAPAHWSSPPRPHAQ
jgi:hypothetical protein